MSIAFTEEDYQRGAEWLGCPAAYIKAVAQVESAGAVVWKLPDGRDVLPVRFEAHVFGKLTGYRFNESNPGLSCRDWNPALAARTRLGAWEQLAAARRLDRQAANEATSWGAFQIMGYHWKRLGFGSVESFMHAMADRLPAGQLDVFVKFIQADRALWSAMKAGDWPSFERIYNGGGFGGAYAEKIAAAVGIFTGEAAGMPAALRMGDRGPAVAHLQRALGVADDGDFGPATDAAVRKVQADHGLVVDGIAGAMTRAALGI